MEFEEIAARAIHLRQFAGGHLLRGSCSLRLFTVKNDARKELNISLAFTSHRAFSDFQSYGVAVPDTVNVCRDGTTAGTTRKGGEGFSFNSAVPEMGSQTRW